MKERDMREKKEIEELSDFFYSVDRTSYLGGPIRVMNYNALALACYDAGYRRQREGEWEIVKGSNGKERMVCSKCRHQQDLASTFTYCPNCGAKMKGGAE